MTGIRRIFHSLGVQGVVTGGQSMNPSTARAARGGRGGARRPGRDPAEQQEHHPGGRAGRRADDQDACASCRPRAITEGFAALLAYDPEADGDENAAAMAEAADARRRRRGHAGGRATRAATSAPIAEGDWLGIARDGIVAVDGDARRMRPPRCSTRSSTDDHEIVTIIEGDGADGGDHPADHGVARRAPAATCTPRSTTAASRCTRTSSASSSARVTRARMTAARSAARARRHPGHRLKGVGDRAAGARGSSASTRCSTCSRTTRAATSTGRAGARSATRAGRGGAGARQGGVGRRRRTTRNGRTLVDGRRSATAPAT